jgi:hypothetical protein
MCLEPSPRDLTFFVFENLKDLGFWVVLGAGIVLIFVASHVFYDFCACFAAVVGWWAMENV